MKLNRLAALLALVAAFFLTPSLVADDEGEHGHPHGHGKGHEKHAMASQRGWERRGNFEYREFGRDEHPPGWSQGKKTGWGNCGMPPGQAKKYGCRSYVYQGRPHYYYQDDDGRTVVRRPVVQIHGSVDIVK